MGSITRTELRNFVEEVQFTYTLSGYSLDEQIKYLLRNDYKPTISFEEVSRFIDNYAKKKLFLYVAAKKSNLDSLANFFLVKWGNSFRIKLFQAFNSQNSLIFRVTSFFTHFVKGTLSFITNSNYSPSQEEKKVATIENRLKRVSHFPLPLGLENYEEDIYNQLENELCKEVIYSRLHPKSEEIPSFMKDVITQVNPDTMADYLICKYRQRIKHLDCSNLTMTSNEDIQKVIYQFPNLQSLDLSHCVRITAQLFKENIPHLEKVVIDGTSLHSRHFPSRLFPSLLQIVQENTLPIYYFDNNSKVLNKKTIENNVFFTANPLDFKQELEKFAKFPTFDKIEIFSTFFEAKDLLHPVVSCFDFYDYQKKILEVFFAIWISNKQLSDTIGRFFEKVLDSSQSKLLITVIDEYPLLEQNEQSFFYTDLSDRGIEHIYRIIHLLRNVNPYFIVTLLKKFENNIPTVKNILRISNDQRALTFGKLFYELMIEASYQTSDGISLRIFLIKPFENPLKAPFYDELANHAIACAYVAKTENQYTRELFHKFILETFANYEYQPGHLDLQQIILGCFDREERNENPFLMSQLEDYESVFIEKIDPNLRDAYWNGLAQGYFGGKKLSLITALEKFYTMYKTEKVLEVLTSLAGECQTEFEKQANFVLQKLIKKE